jgi:hypothetical protein
MSNSRDAEIEQWLRAEVDDAARHLDYRTVIPIPFDEMRRHLAPKWVEWLARKRDGLPIERSEILKTVAQAFQRAQPSKIAPPEWRDQVLHVLTESGSKYVIDTVAWTLQRVRGRAVQDDPEVAPASRLRRDGETLQLLRLIQLEVGASAIADLAPLRSDAVWTRRTTTYVVSIEPRS